MNESIIRSPKWLRNIVDFEINTGEDIKGEPSNKRRMKLKEEEERLKKEKEEKERQEEEERLKKEKEEKNERDKKRGKEFDELFAVVINYIENHYRDCIISVPKTNFLTIKDDGITYKKISFTFKVTLDNTVFKPTFDVHIKWGNEEYEYIASGLIYKTFKMFLINYVYEYMKSNEYQNKHKKSNSNTKSNTNSNEDDYDGYVFHSHDNKTGYSYYYNEKNKHGYYYNPDTGKYYEDGYYNKYTNSDKKTPNDKKDEETLFNEYFKTKYGNSLNNYSDKTANSKYGETTEIQNKRRRYNLLKQTLIGYEREMFKILEWKKQNNNQKHNEEERVKNEIENLIGRMKEMNTTFKFENKKYNFTHLKRFNT